MTVGTLSQAGLNRGGLNRSGLARGSMAITTRRLRSIGWIATLVICAALVMVLAFRVNALRSQVHQSEAKIVALREETMYLETEFETRANQQQLKAWNDVEFGYVAPAASQYLDNERQLAAFAKPIEPGAPAPIRVASADDSVDAAAAFPAMVSPMTGKPADEDAPAMHKAKSASVATLAERLADVPSMDGVPAKKGKSKDKSRDGAKDSIGHASGKDRGDTHPAKKAAHDDKRKNDRHGDGAMRKKATSGHAGVDSARGHASKGTAVATKKHGSGARVAELNAHRRAASGASLTKLALKDAKTVK